MSSINQSNGKKSGSGSSSTVNTPASTPIASVTGANGQTATQTSPPPNNNAPKYGTLVPNRIFVGGISANTTEGELLQLFSNYGAVKAAKIIQDRAGVSKGYGFITFENEDDAKRLQRESDSIVLKERKLNIAPAIKKQPFSRGFDASSPPAVAAGNPAQYYFPPGTMPYFQSALAYYPTPTAPSADPNTQQPPMYQAPSLYSTQSGPPQTATYPPVMFPQPIYMPQQYPMHMPYDYNYYPNGSPPQYMVGGQGGPQSQVPPMQRPGSPPRQPCYSQQLPYNPETMYYNVPMYGTMEGGPAVYQDSLDMANGAIAEDSYSLDDGAQELEIQQLREITNTIEPLSTHDSSPHIVDMTRQSNTPVVSLLSLDQHQEKDFMSMQSGRRRKSTRNTPPNNNNTSHNYNGYTNCYPSYLNNLQIGKYSYSNSCSVPTYSYSQSECNYSKYSKGLNGQDKWSKKKRGDRRTFDTSSMCSVRTDSNSSASLIDDNRNDDKIQSTDVDAQPPAPFSPMTNNNVGNRYFSARNYKNHQRGGGGFDRSRGSTRRNYSVVQTSEFVNKNVNSNSVPVNNEPNNSEPISSVLTFNKPSVSPLSQMHPSHHFIPPARRNKRSGRRNAPQISEIGAGDAPLPNSDVSDACKKLDSLKL